MNWFDKGYSKIFCGRILSLYVRAEKYRSSSLVIEPVNSEHEMVFSILLMKTKLHTLLHRKNSEQNNIKYNQYHANICCGRRYHFSSLSLKSLLSLLFCLYVLGEQFF